MKENTQKHPLATKIIFFGSCPECEMKGIASEMLLNSMDFFECPVCHLQVTAFPDAVAVLKWRGEGEFRKTLIAAQEGFIRQGLFATSDENEILPDKRCRLVDYFDLEEYITNISPTFENWKAQSASYDNFDFSKQEEHLESIEAECWENLVHLWNQVEKDGIPSELFKQLTTSLYHRGIIFNFPWQNWKEGLHSVRRGAMPNALSLIEISKYITLIFRESRNSGIPAPTFKLLQKLFLRLYFIT